jgi:hypothetical protein
MWSYMSCNVAWTILVVVNKKTNLQERVTAILLFLELMDLKNKKEYFVENQRPINYV